MEQAETEKAVELIQNSQPWLMQRIASHAMDNGYAKYTGALGDAWRSAIAGISNALTRLLKERNTPLKFNPDDGFADDPTALFGILEAQRHRARGVPLGMFLGFMKYFRQSYIDLVRQYPSYVSRPDELRESITHFFDRLEIAYCIEWSRNPEQSRLDELQTANIRLINEKNKYLAIVESFAEPILFVDSSGQVEDINRAASELLFGRKVREISRSGENLDRPALPDWLAQELRDMEARNTKIKSIERELLYRGASKQFRIRIRKVQNVSSKLSVAVIIFDDITDFKGVEAKFRHQASYDKLSGLINRRKLNERLAESIGESAKYSRPLSLCVCDIDNFKTINDTQGHQSGDEVIKVFAEIILGNIRDSDYAGRYGGDEFCIVFPNAGAMEAAAALERIRAALEQTVFSFSQDGQMRVSGSFGLAEYKAGASIDEFFNAADRSLYEAKRMGRNRIIWKYE